jgi:hypothetical protein
MNNNEGFFSTENEHGYSVKFSPHDPTLIAAVTGANFGMSGNFFWLIFYSSPNLLLHYQIFYQIKSPKL